jgi:hypothetical protein
MIYDPLEKQLNAIVIFNSFQNLTLQLATAFTANAAMPIIKMNKAK